MEEKRMIQITRDIEKALAEMDAVELIKLFGKLEEIRFGIEDTFGVVIGGHNFYCNTHRQNCTYIIDGEESVTKEEFLALRALVDLELKGTYSISVHIRPPHKRRPGQTEPDGIITIPASLLDETEAYDEETILGKDDE